MQLQLPEPSFDALTASRSLQTLIANDIRHNSGWISFARYMELALYAPGLGYYSGGAAKLGKDGDFTTAPEITPLFGDAIAHVAAELMTRSAPQIMEFGAGSGKLAIDADGRVLSCLGGVWKRLGARYWRDPVPSYADLPATGSVAISSSHG